MPTPPLIIPLCRSRSPGNVNGNFDTFKTQGRYRLDSLRHVEEVKSSLVSSLPNWAQKVVCCVVSVDGALEFLILHQCLHFEARSPVKNIDNIRLAGGKNRICPPDVRCVILSSIISVPPHCNHFSYLATLSPCCYWTSLFKHHYQRERALTPLTSRKRRKGHDLLPNVRYSYFIFHYIFELTHSYCSYVVYRSGMAVSWHCSFVDPFSKGHWTLVTLMAGWQAGMSLYRGFCSTWPCTYCCFILLTGLDTSYTTQYRNIHRYRKA